MCHLLLALPVLGLPLFWVLPLSIALPIYLGLLGVSLVLYRAIWPTLRRPAMTGREGMIGQEGVVVTPLQNYGKIKVGNELWLARAGEPLSAGDRVTIVRFEGLTAIVRPSSAHHATPE
ncbi:MAG: hypothetical protein D6736_17975 [Nitrospinota bacterium]|nr:MAG: hypothetical protein D6736_17975 [Nitrospinota bacterium]